MTVMLDQVGDAGDAGAVSNAIARARFGPIVRPLIVGTPSHDDEVTITIRRFDLLNPDLDIQPRPVNLPPDASPFDIDVADLGPTTKVRIVLQDNRYALTSGEYSITAGEDEGHPHLRRGQGDSRQVEFYVLRGRDRVSFNIGMRALATNLDFYVDPKIENNG